MIDGIQLARRCTSNGRKVPLLITCGGRQPAKAEIADHGHCIPKPYRPTDVLNEIAAMDSEAAARAADFRTWRTWCGAPLSFVLALAAGDALSQNGGCARCATVPAALEVAAPQRPAESRRTKRVAVRYDLRSERPKRGAFGGSYVVCVRACDGSFFPISYFGGSPSDQQEVCQSLCPNATVALYSLPFGGTIDEAVSINGEPYANLSNAHKFEQTFDASCSCRALGQSWAEALAAAEAKYGHHPHDTIVTEEQSLRMSRPLQDPNETPAVPQSAQGGATTAAELVEPADNLDINGIDTGLKAAAAAMSRATSGIQYEGAQNGANYGLHQGQMVDETGPDRRSWRVRILPPAF